MDNIILNLTYEEYKTILESLVFSCSTDISASWYEADYQSMKNLAIKMRNENPQILTDNIEIMEDILPYEDFWTNEIKEKFLELTV
jgi:hypothetical protein